MQTADSFFQQHSQNFKIPLRLISPKFGHLPKEVLGNYGLTHRKTYYFLIFMREGFTHHSVDLHPYKIASDELLFILPHQIHELPPTKEGTDYFKIGFDENCLSYLPKQYPFLINPFNKQTIRFQKAASSRITSTFEILAGLLTDFDTDPELILAHLNSLLTEINSAYFSGDKNPADGKLSKYIDFKQFVERSLSDQPSIQHIAEKLSLNTNGLYNIVKHYSGLSPKGFITNRLILEAKRRLYYAENTSIKELAYDLGFNDPEYFSRLFKKETGQTIALFVQDSSGN